MQNLTLLIFAALLLCRVVVAKPWAKCLSVKCVNCDRTKETGAHIFIPQERMFILVFRYEEWLVGVDPL